MTQLLTNCIDLDGEVDTAFATKDKRVSKFPRLNNIHTSISYQVSQTFRGNMRLNYTTSIINSPVKINSECVL